MNVIDICPNGQTWDVSIDGWFQGNFSSLHDAYDTAYRLSNENGNAEIVVYGDTPTV